MSRNPITSWLIAGSLVLLSAALGYAIGTGSANDGSDAAAAREEGYASTYTRTLEKVAAESRRRGLKTGIKRGRKAGETIGFREGVDLGGGHASVQVLQSEENANEAAAAAAQTELADRQANCGVLVRSPDSCPTSAEVAAYRAAIVTEREARRRAEEPDDDGE